MKTIRTNLIIALSLFLGVACLSFRPATPAAESGIKWLTWDQMQEAQKKEPRKILVDVYTGWCGWCKRMDATTYQNKTIVDYINTNFYAIKFDAESRETINFRGRDFKYVSDGMHGYNELAAEILNNQMSYPTVVYMDEKLDEIFPVPGYEDAKMFETVLNFVVSNSYKSTHFEEYQQSFKGKIK
ncbi:MAG TPA: DUF255 domain-containing protein [Chitinophagales bacterium]|nr:DUF255 domain-containing protein [Chitinophagales bacterium]